MRRNALLGTLFGLALLAACKPHFGGKTLRLRYWGDLDEIRIVEQICRDFEKAHPGVRVLPERKSYDVYQDVLMQELAAGTAADVIFMGPDQVDPLAAGGKLANLDSYLAKSGLKKADFYPSIYERLSYQGHLLVLPRDVAPVAVIYYNKKLFDQAKLPYPKDDWHWEDLRAAAIKLTHRDPSGQASHYGFADEWNISDAWMLSAGGTLVDDEAHPTRITLGSGPSAEGLLFRWKLLQQDKVMPGSSENKALSGGNQALFLNGQLAMFHSGIWKSAGFRGIKDFDWDVVRFPTKQGAKDPRFVVAGSGYAMKAGTAEPDLAWGLIYALGGPEGQRSMAASGLTQPAIKSIAQSPAFLDGKKPLNKAMLLKAAELGRMSPIWVPWQEFLKTIWTPKTDLIWMQDYEGDPAKAILEAQQEGQRKFFK